MGFFSFICCFPVGHWKLGRLRSAKNFGVFKKTYLPCLSCMFPCLWLLASPSFISDTETVLWFSSAFLHEACACTFAKPFWSSYFATSKSFQLGPHAPSSHPKHSSPLTLTSALNSPLLTDICIMLQTLLPTCLNQPLCLIPPSLSGFSWAAQSRGSNIIASVEVVPGALQKCKYKNAHTKISGGFFFF